MKWIYLVLAILFEVAGTTSMKLAEGFSKPLYAIPIFIFYLVSLSLLTLALRYFAVSTVYAVWSGMGIALIAFIGVVYFQESLNWAKLVGLALIIAGVVVLNLMGGGNSNH